MDAERRINEGLATGDPEYHSPDPIYPDAGGLLKWGHHDSGYRLWWLTEGEPDRWTVLVQEDDAAEFVVYEGTAAGVLADMMEEKVDIPFIAEEEPEFEHNFKPLTDPTGASHRGRRGFTGDSVMHPDVERLTRLAPPPPRPAPVDLDAFERETGAPLPADFADLMRTYGPGVFDDFVAVLAPDLSEPDNSMFARTEDERRINEGLAKDLEGHDFPYPIDPDAGGLLKWGHHDSGHRLWWLMKGEPCDEHSFEPADDSDER